MRGDSLSTLLKINSIVKLAGTSYQSFCTSAAFNVASGIFNTFFYCDAPNHGIVSFLHKKYQEKLVYNKKKFIEMKQI